MKGRKFIALMTAASLLTPVAAGIVNPTSAFASLPVLKLGDQGTYVTTLQKSLNGKGYLVTGRKIGQHHRCSSKEVSDRPRFTLSMAS